MRPEPKLSRLISWPTPFFLPITSERGAFTIFPVRRFCRCFPRGLGRSIAGALWLATAAAACRRPPEAPPAPPSSTAAATPRASGDGLPDLPGFAAGAPTRGAGYARRTYTRGAARIDVTLARMPMSPDDYARWVAASTASFPQAALELPAGDGNGFYQCTGEPPAERCDLLIQLRAGVHVEIRGGGTSTRADVDALARGLPLRALADGERSP
jgi:hypothetical protein